MNHKLDLFLGGWVRNIIRILNYLSKSYYFLSLFIALIIFIFLLMAGIYQIGIYAGSGFALYIQESSSGSAADLKLQFNEVFQDLLKLFAVIPFYLLSSFIIKGISKFLEAKNNKAAIHLQKEALAPLPKYIILSYLINILLLFSTSNMSETNSKIGMFFENYMDLLFPDFGNALGLLFALVIFVYSKSLNEQEAIELKVEQLNKEAELVI